MIETAIDMAIGIPEVETGNLAKAIAKRCPALRHGVLIAPLGHPLSVFSESSSIRSKPIRSSHSRNSSVDSNDWSAQYSYSTASRGPELFASNTNSTVTMTLTKDANGKPIVMRILLDPCCTGTRLISARVADSLGLDIHTTCYTPRNFHVRRW